MMDGMHWESLGEDAWIVRNLVTEPWRYVESAESLPGVLEAAACFESLGVWTEEGFDPAVFEGLTPSGALEPRTIVVPTVYDGPDLAEAAGLLQMSEAELAALHASVNYRCGAVGFQPGFPYLGPLPAPLDRLPRRSSPRPRVPKGSVAIAAGMSGIYPGESPGGWWLLGRTDLPLVMGERTLFRAGDIARFVAI
ncbi:carboxyltransferase domain-containing protein [bacterium]|nr:MAG: carboxyltransferase domain-containing protein [bacterium]